MDDDTKGDMQSQAGAGPRFLDCEEGVEDTRLDRRWDTGAGIVNFDYNPPILLRGP